MLCPRDKQQMVFGKNVEREVIGEFISTCVVSIQECPKCGVMVKTIVPVIYRMKGLPSP